jgi:subtilisin family serine protease
MALTRLGLAFLLGTAALVSLTLFGAGAAGADPSSAIKLSKHERALVAEARANGESTITLMIASKGKANGVVAKGLESIGATVAYREDQLDYIRAAVPLDKLGDALALDGVLAVDVDEEIPLDDPRPGGMAPIIPQPAPNASTPRANPYMPTQDTGAAQFVNANPTWDGRGVTVGIVDTGISFDHPSLTTTSTGEAKIVDWVTGGSPFDSGSGLDPTWINMATQVSAAPTFAFDERTFTAPAAGTYRVGFFRENHPRFGGEFARSGQGPGGDLNRDGDHADRFYLLWETSSNQVYVDLDQDNSFADETGMTDYRVAKQVGSFGTDNPATAVREQVPFVIQTDGKNKFVNLGIISGAHGSHVAGIVAGNAFFGGEMSGAAPGAKIVSSRACLFVAGCFSHALLEGMIQVAQQQDVDVINMSIGGLPALNDGNNTRCRVYSRLIEQYNVQMFISIGNSGPGLNTAGDPGLCDRVMGVGASITDDTYLADYGIQKSYEDSLLYFSSRGPREDGGFQPRIVAPGAAISSTPMWQGGGGLASTLPPGFSLFNGTSMAAPQAAGAAALLVSAAKAAGVQHQPAQLRLAISSTARFITEGENGPNDRLLAYDQGNGLVNVGAAWSLLQAPGGLNTVEIVSAVPVSSALSGFLATPHVGQGIYDRESTASVRPYTFTRTSGPGGSVTYNVSWEGNDGTFSAPGSISLPKNKAATLDVVVAPGGPGAHSAILRLDDPATPGIDYQTMNTVIVPLELDESNEFTQTVTGDVDIAQQEHYFYRVPSGTPAMKVDMNGGSPAAGTGQMRFLRWHPWGLGIDSNAVSNCYNPPPPGAGCAGGTATSRTATDPAAGVWEISMDARRSSDADNAPFTLTTSLLGATVDPDPDVIEEATVGVPIARSYTITNEFGPFTGRAIGTALGSAVIARPSIANLGQNTTEVTVAAGSTSLRATIGNPSDPAADLDLFVFNCTTGTCVLAGQNADGDSEESVTINNPAAGLWRILVDGFAVPAGTTEYDYLDVFANPAFGSVSVTDANALRPAGASWNVSGSVTANAAPAEGRVLLGNVQVRTDENVLVGSGDVIVESVTTP